MDNEEKYSEIRNKLQNLEAVKASDDFERRLHLKIVELEAEKRHAHEKKYDEPRGGFLRNLFTNRQYPWLAPAVGFTVLLFFVFYMTYLNKTSVDSTKDMTTSQQPVEQKNAVVPGDTSKNLSSLETEKQNEKQKDIAGNIESYKEESKAPEPVENRRNATDKDGYYDYTPKQEKPVEELKMDDLKDQEAPSVDKKETFEKGVVPELKGGREAESEAPADESELESMKSGIENIGRAAKDSTRNKMSMKKDTTIKTPDEKLETMNKENLEKLLEKIQNK